MAGRLDTGGASIWLALLVYTNGPGFTPRFSVVYWRIRVSTPKSRLRTHWLYDRKGDDRRVEWNDRYQFQRGPRRTLRQMTAADISGAAALTQSVGWAHDAADWERLLSWSPEGCFVIDEGDRGIIGTVSTTPYDTALAWIGSLVVAPDRQRQGLGRQLLQAALDHLVARRTERIMLDASEAGRTLYEQAGFRALYKVERWEGRASTYLGPRARRLRQGDIPALLKLDRALYGVDRSPVLIRLLADFPQLAWVDFQQGELEGYLIGRQSGEQVGLGPWMSWSAQGAERLLLVALEALQGQSIVLNVPDNNGRGMLLASDHNLHRVRYCTRMIYGDASPPNTDPLAQIAVGWLATG